MATRITVLGGVGVEKDGQALDRLPAQRVRFALLLYLAVERQAARESLLGVLWPERPPEKARHLLSQTLYELRQDLGDDWVRSAGEHLIVSDDVVTDLEEMAAAVEANDHARALSLYAGRFMGGATLGGSRELDGWVDRQEARVTRLHRQARRAAIDAAVTEGDLATALRSARAWADLDPLDDEAQHRLIELLGATGDRAEALRQYERYAGLMEQELELEPLDETQALVERIRAGDVGARPPAPSPAPVSPVPPPPASAGVGRGRPAGHGRRRTWLRNAAGIALLGAAAFAGRVLLPAERGESARSDAALDVRRIAVLYFDDLSPSQDLGPVAAGFTESLIHELDQVDGLEVLSRTAVEPFRDSVPPVDTLVAALGAGTFVEGSITRVADSLRVTFQLIDGATAVHMLSGTVSRPEAEVASLSRELPRLVARRLRERLGTAIVLRKARGGTESGEAWLLVQRAQVLMEDESEIFRDDAEAGLALLERADSMLRRAEAADPDWPEPTLRRAQVEIARAGRTAAIPGQYEPAATRRAMQHLERALRKDPEFVEALERRGRLRFALSESAEGLPPEEFDRLRRLAEEDLRRAVELDAGHARGWWGLSQILRRKGSFAEAKQAARRALAADAFLEVSVEGLFQLFHTSFEREEHAEAAEWCDELRKRTPGTMRGVQCELLLLASSPVVEPDVPRAWALVDSMVALGHATREEIYRGWATLFVAKTLVRDDRPDSARAVLRRTVPEPPAAWALYDAAHLSLMLGDAPEALRYLALYLEANPEQAEYLASDWWFRPLHEEPRFIALVEGTSDS